MNTHDIELPPLPQGEYRLSPDSRAPTLYDEEAMEAYARAAIEAERQARGKPVALMREAALHLTNWLDKDECECEGPGHQCGRTQVERCRDQLLDASPQPQQIHEEVPRCVVEVALQNLEHDNYERSYSGYTERQADIGLIRAMLEAAPEVKP